jgi:starch-binding outer membrane protein, SusD/RagB family
MRIKSPGRALRCAQAAASAAALAAGVASCSLDVVDPNNASEVKVLTSADGAQALAVGMQQFYANNVLGVLFINTGVTSRELTINQTFLGQVIIEEGGPAMDGSVGELATIFGNELDVMRMSELLIAGVPTLPLEPGTRSGILALAHLFRARAIGDLTTVFERTPVSSSPDENAKFYPRNEALDSAIAHLNVAAKLIADTPVSAAFNTRIKGSRLDLANTIHAWRARYLLFSGKYQDAIDATARVAPAAASYFVYDAQNRNPIFVNLVQTIAYGARDNLGSPLTEPGDARVPFFLTPDPLLSNPKRYPVDKLGGFFSGNASPIPAYVPGEMPLISVSNASVVTGPA